MYTNFYRTLLQALVKLTQYNSCLCPSFSSKFLVSNVAILLTYDKETQLILICALYCYLTCLVEVSIQIHIFSDLNYLIQSIPQKHFNNMYYYYIYRSLNILAQQCSEFLLKHRSIVEFQFFIQYNLKTALALLYLTRRLDDDVSRS